MDGAYIATTLTPIKSFRLEAGDQVRIDVLDTNAPNFDVIANAPAGYSARRSVWWVRALDADVDYYRVEEREAPGDWAVIGMVPNTISAWTFSLLSSRLTDLATCWWRVRSVDRAGNVLSALTLSAETIVRTPDAPDFTVTFDEGTTKVTFAAA